MGAGGGLWLNVLNIEDTRRAEDGEHLGSRSGRSKLQATIGAGMWGTGDRKVGSGGTLSATQWGHFSRETLVSSLQRGRMNRNVHFAFVVKPFVQMKPVGRPKAYRRR